MSNCFEVYLRNTTRIYAQHAKALADMHQAMANLALAIKGMKEITYTNVVFDYSMGKLEDEN